MTDQDQAAAKRAEEQAAATKKRDEDTRKRLAEERDARQKEREERMAENAKVKPTPTQEENDLAMSGVHIAEHEPDGSPEQSTDHPMHENDRRQPSTRETKPAAHGSQSRADYSTRTSNPASTHKSE
ncbi:hypothetical protein [Bradyrhizobium zhanjiangense]|uniref:Uncharacterized protein n=1 Tax=Bradyrhizobium zhanjiangense TaxID=1325107 RepID=A0ABY0DH62_9BRAD|nr:hypothetical protein [Bradyrhizobium zhanjiangense]RXG91580.1 hypothetical protein EAS62_24180 [Bradyrhizobium zhanjiangense]